MLKELSAEANEIKKVVGVMSGAMGVETKASEQLSYLNVSKKVAAAKFASKQFQLPLPFIRKFDSEQSVVSYRRRAMPKILIVDGNLIHAAASKMIWEKYFQDVYVAADGKKALSLMEHIPFDCVFMAPNLRGLSGPQVTEIIRHTEDVSQAAFRTYVVAMFSPDQMHDTELLDMCFISGMDRHITKPLLTHALLFANILTVGQGTAEGFRRIALEKEWYSRFPQVRIALKGTLEQRKNWDEVTFAKDELQKAEKRMLAVFDDEKERRSLEELLARQRSEDISRMSLELMHSRERISELEYQLELTEEENRRNLKNNNDHIVLSLEERIRQQQQENETLAIENQKFQVSISNLTADVKNLLVNGSANEKLVRAAERRSDAVHVKMECVENRMMELEDFHAQAHWQNYYGQHEVRSVQALPPMVTDVSSSWYNDALKNLKNGTYSYTLASQRAESAMQDLLIRKTYQKHLTIDKLREDMSDALNRFVDERTNASEKLRRDVDATLAQILLRELSFWKYVEFDDEKLGKEIAELKADIIENRFKKVKNSVGMQAEEEDFDGTVPEVSGDNTFLTTEQAEKQNTPNQLFEELLKHVGGLRRQATKHAMTKALSELQQRVEDERERQLQHYAMLSRELTNEMQAMQHSIDDPKSELVVEKAIPVTHGVTEEAVTKALYNVSDNIHILVQLALETGKIRGIAATMMEEKEKHVSITSNNTSVCEENIPLSVDKKQSSMRRSSLAAEPSQMQRAFTGISKGKVKMGKGKEKKKAVSMKDPQKKKNGEEVVMIPTPSTFSDPSIPETTSTTQSRKQSLADGLFGPLSSLEHAKTTVYEPPSEINLTVPKVHPEIPKKEIEKEVEKETETKAGKEVTAQNALQENDEVQGQKDTNAISDGVTSPDATMSSHSTEVKSETECTVVQSEKEDVVQKQVTSIEKQKQPSEREKEKKEEEKIVVAKNSAEKKVQPQVAEKRKVTAGEKNISPEPEKAVFSGLTVRSLSPSTSPQQKSLAVPEEVSIKKPETPQHGNDISFVTESIRREEKRHSSPQEEPLVVVSQKVQPKVPVEKTQAHPPPPKKSTPDQIVEVVQKKPLSPSRSPSEEDEEDEEEQFQPSVVHFDLAELQQIAADQSEFLVTRRVNVPVVTIEEICDVYGVSKSKVVEANKDNRDFAMDVVQGELRVRDNEQGGILKVRVSGVTLMSKLEAAMEELREAIERKLVQSTLASSRNPNSRVAKELRNELDSLRKELETQKRISNAVMNRKIPGWVVQGPDTVPAGSAHTDSANSGSLFPSIHSQGQQGAISSRITSPPKSTNATTAVQARHSEPPVSATVEEWMEDENPRSHKKEIQAAFEAAKTQRQESVNASDFLQTKKINAKGGGAQTQQHRLFPGLNTVEEKPNKAAEGLGAQPMFLTKALRNPNVEMHVPQPPPPKEYRQPHILTQMRSPHEKSPQVQYLMALPPKPQGYTVPKVQRHPPVQKSLESSKLGVFSLSSKEPLKRQSNEEDRAIIDWKKRQRDRQAEQIAIQKYHPKRW